LLGREAAPCSATEVGANDDRPAEIRIRQVGIPKMGIGQIGPTEVGSC